MTASKKGERSLVPKQDQRSGQHGCDNCRGPRRPTFGVGVLIRRYDGKFLIGKRGQACRRGAGLWALPGGMCEPGETAVSVVVREVREETGLLVCVAHKGQPPFQTVQPFAITDHYPEEDHLSLWVVARLQPDSPRQPSALEPTKCAEWKWASMKEVLSMPGASDASDPQYYWLPGPILQMVSPLIEWR